MATRYKPNLNDEHFAEVREDWILTPATFDLSSPKRASDDNFPSLLAREMIRSGQFTSVLCHGCAREYARQQMTWHEERRQEDEHRMFRITRLLRCPAHHIVFAE